MSGWVQSSVTSDIPPNAVCAGNDVDGSPIYIGRTVHDGDQIPVKVLPTKNAAYIAYAGAEIPVYNFEVLIGEGFTWVPCANGQTAAHAVIAGQQSNGESLYVGRAQFQGSLTPGKIHQSHGCLYVPFGGAEHSVQHYECLVLVPQRYYWVSASTYASNATLGGNDIDGSALFIGRAYHDGDTLPAKVVPGQQIAYVAYDGQEISKDQYEVLCGGNLSWIPSGHGALPPNAVQGGTTKDGELLYIGRAHFQGSITPGKVHPSNGCLYIPFNGEEVSIKSYEILVEN